MVPLSLLSAVALLWQPHIRDQSTDPFQDGRSDDGEGEK